MGKAQIEASVLGGIRGDNDTFEAGGSVGKDVDWRVGCCGPGLITKSLCGLIFGFIFGGIGGFKYFFRLGYLRIPGGRTCIRILDSK